MWKTKLAYMALGALIASIGYFIGTFNNLNAEDEVARVKRLIVSEKITVGEEGGNALIEISPSDIMVGGLTKSGALPISMITPGEMILLDGSETKNLRAEDLDLAINIRSTSISYLVMSIRKMMPIIEMHKPNGKKVSLSVDRQAEIKLTNGGLKSKTVAVD